MNQQASRAINELDSRGKTGVLLICCTSLFIVGLDITAVNVALPSIGRDLHAGISDLQWTIDAYTVVIASLLMLSGSVGDRIGRRRMFVIGLVLFTMASLCCSLAWSVGALIAFRALQAIGGSMLNPIAMSIITNTFTEPRERAQAVGVWGATFGLSMALGPVIGGTLVTAVSWRAIFLINIPVGIAAMVLALRSIPESRAETARRFDPVGQAMIIVLFATLTFGIIEAPRNGWTSALIIASFACAAAALAGILLYEPRRESPLLDLRFFRSIPFSSAIVTAVAATTAFGGFLFLNTLYLQDVRHLSPLKAGLTTLPMAAMIALVSPISGRLVGRHGPRRSLAIAGIGTTIGCLMLTNVSASTSYGWLIAAYTLFGLGFGFVNSPITNTAVSGMPRAQAGVAAAIGTTSRQVGQTLGVAIAGAIVTSRIGTSGGGALASASHPAWWLLASLGGVVLVLSLVATTTRARNSAQRTAAELNPEALAA